MGFDEIITSRRTAYRFTEQPINKSYLQQALFAASQAPCHKHTHPWKFYVIGDKTKQKLIPTIARLAKAKSVKSNSSDFEKDRLRAINKIISIPMLIAVTSRKSPDDEFRQKEDYAATVCALHNMVLSFWNNSIASQWSTGSLTRDLETYDILSINYAKEEIIGLIKIGYPESLPNITKLPVDEFTRYLE